MNCMCTKSLIDLTKGLCYNEKNETGGLWKQAESKLDRFDPEPDLDNANVGMTW